MQVIRTALSSPRLRNALPRAVLAVTMALDQCTRRPPLAAYLVHQFLT